MSLGCYQYFRRAETATNSLMGAQLVLDQLFPLVERIEDSIISKHGAGSSLDPPALITAINNAGVDLTSREVASVFKLLEFKPGLLHSDLLLSLLHQRQRAHLTKACPSNSLLMPTTEVFFQEPQIVSPAHNQGGLKVRKGK